MTTAPEPLPDDPRDRAGVIAGGMTADTIRNGTIRAEQVESKALARPRTSAGLPEVAPCGSCNARINPLTGECGCSD